MIAGWDDGGHQQKLEQAIRQREIQDSVLTVGPQFGLDKEQTLAHVDAFILPSYSEGLPMAVLEAWSYRLPVLMTEPCNLTIGFEREAALKISTQPKNIAQGIETLAQMSDHERKVIGNRGIDLIRERYTWDAVTNDLVSVYQWLLGKGTAPHCVVSS